MPSLPVFLERMGLVLGLLTVLLFLRHRHWRVFPFFSVYFFALLLRIAAIDLAERWMTPAEYSMFFWDTRSAVVLLRSSAVWEVVRQLFPRGHALRTLALSTTLVVAIGIGAFVMLTDVSTAPTTSRAPEPYTDLARKGTLFAAIWIGAVGALAAVYRVPVTRPVWGMALGLGIDSAISLMNTAAFGIFPSFTPFWQLLSQAHFSILMLFWIWGFAAPNERGLDVPAGAKSHEVSTARMSTWHAHWRRLREAVRMSGRR